MSIIVSHKRTGNSYIFLGIEGQGEKNNSPGRFLSDLFTQDESELATTLVLVCDVAGKIFVADIDDLIVIEIDGKKPAEILPETANTTNAIDKEPSRPLPDDYAEEKQTADVVNFSQGDRDDDFDDFDEEEEWI